MWRVFTRREQTPESLKFLDNLTDETAGDVAAALQIGLAGLSPEQQVQEMKELLRMAPPALRIAALGHVIPRPEFVDQIRTSMLAEERRPMLVQALVERARQTQTIDLGEIPEGTAVAIRMYPNDKDHIYSSPEDLRHHKVATAALGLRALGGAAFASREAIYNFVPEGETIFANILADSAFTLRSRNERGEPTNVVRFGGPVLAEYDGQTMAASCQGTPLFLGGVSLDRTTAFTNS